jgi:hypothetical protein
METGGAGSDRIKFENAAKHVKNDYQIILNVKGSNIENFNLDKLDCHADGLPYKNNSVYVEARKLPR